MISQIISALPDTSNHHARSSKLYAVLERAAGSAIKDSQLTLSNGGGRPIWRVRKASVSISQYGRNRYPGFIWFG